MSAEHQLTIQTADPTAEITVYDASFSRVARGVGGYRGSHPDALYEIRVRTAGTQEEQLISLAGDKTVNVGPVAFASPVPLTNTTTTDPNHEAAVLRACEAPVSVGSGSGLLIVVRAPIGGEPSTRPGSPATGLSLIGADGTVVYDVGEKAAVDASGRSPVAVILVHVNPGVYRLRMDLPGQPSRERTLVASPGWTTQCFMIRRSFRDQVAADLAHGSLSLSQLGQPFAADDKRTRLSEAASDALANNRKVTQAAARALLEEKFQDPMLGLLVGHLLLRDTPEASILGEVVGNLVKLLGSEHPDVQALMLAASSPDAPSSVTQMPMLRPSWDAIVARTLTQPSLVPAQSPAALVSARVLPSTPWLIWEAADAPTARQADAKMAVLRGFLNRPAEPSLEGAAQYRDFSFSAPSPPSLDTEDRAELARSLGVPSSVLDDMLAKLDK